MIIFILYRTATDCRTLCGHSGPVYGIHFSHDKTFLASASEDGTSKDNHNKQQTFFISKQKFRGYFAFFISNTPLS